MYWSDTTRGKIYSAFINGTGVTELVTTRVEIPGDVFSYVITCVLSYCIHNVRILAVCEQYYSM